MVGAAIVAMAVGVAGMGLMVVRLAVSTFSLTCGPSLGIFTVGLYCPFANSWVGRLYILNRFYNLSFM